MLEFFINTSQSFLSTCLVACEPHQKRACDLGLALSSAHLAALADVCNLWQ